MNKSSNALVSTEAVTTLSNISFLPMKFLDRVELGLKNTRPRWRILVSIFTVYGVLWGVIEPAAGLWSGMQEFFQSQVAGKYVLFIIVSIVIGALRMAVKDRINLCIPGSNTMVTIQVGNLFDFRGHKVIPVNDLFDSELGDKISPDSLHGQCIQRCFENNSNLFDTEISKNLASVIPTECGTDEIRKRYPVGTIAVVSQGSERLFLAALSKTDRQSNKVESDANYLWVTLTSLWKKVRLCGNGKPIAIPMIGSGLSGIDMPYTMLIRFIITSIYESTKVNGFFTSQVYILLNRESFEQVDLLGIAPELTEENLL